MLRDDPDAGGIVGRLILAHAAESEGLNRELNGAATANRQIMASVRNRNYPVALE